MAGIQGQPAPRPSNVNSPVPGQSELDAFMQAQPKEAAGAASAAGGSNSELDQFMASQGGGQAPPSGAMVDPNSLGGRAVQMGADVLPGAGGIVGMVGGAAMAGGPTVGAGAIPGAMAGGAFGGAIGQQLKSAIEAKVLGKHPGTMGEQLMNDAKSAVLEGLGAGIGAGANAAGRAALKTPAGKAIAGAGDSALDKVVNAATPVVAYMKSAVNDAYNKLAEPVLNILDSKSTHLNTEQAGNAVKQLFADDINKRFGGFVKSYKTLDEVAQAMPLKDTITDGANGALKIKSPRYDFVQEFKAWAADNHSGDYFRMAQKYGDDMLAASNGKSFNSVIQQMNDASAEAYAKGATNQAKAIREMRDMADNWYEGQVSKLAQKIQSGGGSTEEKSFLQQLNAKMANQGLDAKAIAKEYLENRDTVKASYAKFRGFLEDVGEQTRVRANGISPMNFVRNIQDVPSEKLIEKMFDPKNAQALRAMQSETPGVFDQVVKSKMSGLIQQASADGNLDLQVLRKSLNKLPGSTRDILMTPAEQKTLNDTLASPKLGALQALEKSAQDGLIDKFHRIAALTGAVAQKGVTDIGKNLAAPAIFQQGSVAAMKPLANAYFPAGQKAQGQ